MSDDGARMLRAAADALALLPPMLKEQYVATLRLYADEPWRMGGRCRHCSEPIYQTDAGRWRHTNGMYVCTVQVPNAERTSGWRVNKAEPVDSSPT